ncbi:MAG: alpha/beta fold hydrolase [Verrucomicrobiota bacterium]
MKDFPLVLIHGYPFDHTMWYSAIASLGAQCKVLAPDLPGFGKIRVSPDATPSLEFYADFIAATLDENRADRAVVAGMSMGGYVALAFAEKYPQLLNGLGLISTQTAADTPEARKGRKEAIQKIIANGPRVASDALIPKAFAQPEPKNPDLKDYLIKGAENAGADGLCWALEAMAKRPDRTHVLSEIDVPILIAHGTEDQIVPFKKMRDLAEECRKPIFVSIPNAGHATPLEAPDQIASALARLMNAARQQADAGNALP